jgi:proline iminopeptidase
MTSDRILVTLADRRASYVPLGSGEPLVCVPGGPGLPGTTLGDLGGLDRGRTLIRPDWRGAGDSETPGDDRHRVEDYAADLELLREALGLEWMDLLGHSFGGLVAASYAATHPDRVRRLVLDGVPNWLEKDRIAGLELPVHFARWDATGQAFAKALSEAWYWPAIGWFLEHEWASTDPTVALAQVTAPTLVVTGELDVTCGEECATELAAACRDATVAVIAGAGHFTAFEEPERYRSHVEGFLNRPTNGVA